jgi:hypothetical protein
MKVLTIGSAVYDDFDGVYFTYQSLRLNNSDILEHLDFVIIDNNPTSAEGQATKEFCQNASIRYIPYTDKQSTTVRNQIFQHAEGLFTMSIDCHVLFDPLAIKKLIQFFKQNLTTGDLYHGPMLYDSIIKDDPVTHMKPQWRDQMYGVWESEPLTSDDPIEIPMHGLGVFACKTDQWLGFHPDFQGFGGEEGYIHAKFHQAAKKVWCLPFLQWIHRFQRPRGVQYNLRVEDRIKNYFLGWKELNKDPQEIVDHFRLATPQVNLDSLLAEVFSDSHLSPHAINSVNWDATAIKFNNPTEFKFLKLELHESCLLNKVHKEPQARTPARIQYASAGISGAPNFGDHLTNSFATISCDTGPQQLTLEWEDARECSELSIYHTERRISCSISNNLRDWSTISII